MIFVSGTLLEKKFLFFCKGVLEGTEFLPFFLLDIVHQEPEFGGTPGKRDSGLENN